MKLIYENIGHVICFVGGYASELIIENQKLFFEVVSNLAEQCEGGQGKAVLSISDKPLEFSRYADISLQFAPFVLNRKALLTKLVSSLEQRSLMADLYEETSALLQKLEIYMGKLAEDLPFDIDCKKLAIGPVIKALSPEIEETDMDVIEKVFSYMELVRALDHDRLFIMINMRSYFSNEEMERFVESACLHDFKLLLVESTSRESLKNTKRYTIDADLCEF